MLPESIVLTKITNEDDNIQLLSKGNGGISDDEDEDKSGFRDISWRRFSANVIAQFRNIYWFTVKVLCYYVDNVTVVLVTYSDDDINTYPY